jgi:hypothetical protein
VARGFALVQRLDPAFALQLHELLPHRLSGHPESLRELGDGERSFSLERFEDALAGPCGLRAHGGHPTPRGRGWKAVREKFSIISKGVCRATRLSTSGETGVI